MVEDTPTRQAQIASAGHKPLHGRPIQTDDKLPTANSMRQVEAWIHMPVALIKSLKDEGCQAFDSANRVKLGVLLRFFFDQYLDEDERPPDGLATWREALNRVQTQRQEIALDKDRGDVIEVAAAKQQAADAEVFYFDELDRLVREMPAALSGLSPEQIHARLEQFTEELRKQSRKKFALVGNPE